MAANYGEFETKLVCSSKDIGKIAEDMVYFNSRRNPIQNYLYKIRNTRELELAIDVVCKHLKDCKVIYNPPATIVIWSDDTKTVVKTTDGEKFDPERGFLQAFYEKFSGLTRTQGNKLLKDLREQYEEVENELD